MTIASEINRLQTDKEAMRQAIIGKGVDVSSSVSLDDYAACISAISSGPTTYPVKVLAVGGGGGGSSSWLPVDKYKGGGGGGAVICADYNISDLAAIFIGQGGCRGQSGASECLNGCPGGDTLIIGGDGLTAKGGGGGGYNGVGGASGSGCLGGGICSSCDSGGGGGAGGNAPKANRRWGGCGGVGLYGYGGGGGGMGSNGCCGTSDGGGRGGCNATNYGGGGGGGYNPNGPAGNGCQGMVEICYKSDGSSGFTTATGGQCCYTCDGYCVHRFTSNGTFIIVS